MAARMIVFGLTGSIGMGKSTVLRQCAALGAKTLSADAVVHRLLGPGGGAVEAVRELFPESYEAGAIHRGRLGRAVFNDPAALARLEAVMHPRVQREEEAFLHAMRLLGARVAVLDIPLLFETGGEERVDATLVVTAPAFIQRARVLRRQGMTPEKFAAILARQLPDAEKRMRADYVIHTGLGLAASFRQAERILKELL